MTITKEIEDLFRKCRSALGAPIMEVELTDQNLCDALDMAIEDYAERTQNWIIEQQWANMYGKNLTNIDLAFALSVRTLDMSKDFSYWFSKDAGLQQRGPWELKKDFFTIECGKQSYIVPAGREINRVMWCNPPTTQAAVYAQVGGMMGADLGLSSFGGTAYGGYGPYGGIGGFYFGQAYDIAYTATDLQYKTRMLNGDMWYKVTAGPEGTHIIHLFGNPRRFSFGGWAGLGPGMISLEGCTCWYTYYDVSNGGEDECRRMNPDVILTPDQIPLEKMEYGLLNGPTKTIVRKLFIAKAKQMLANVRGKFSGRISIHDAEAQLDYTMLLTQAKDEYDDAMKELTERLSRMTPYKIMEQQSKMADDMAKIMANKPMLPIVG